METAAVLERPATPVRHTGTADESKLEEPLSGSHGERRVEPAPFRVPFRLRWADAALRALRLVPGHLESVGLPLWASLGSCGSIGMAVAGTRVGDIPVPGRVPWWFAFPLAGHLSAGAVFYVSLCALIAAWVGVGIEARAGRLTGRWAWALLVAWATPLVIGPPLFGRDVYSYVGQGILAQRGLDPYSVGPVALGRGHLLSSIVSVWRTTPAPYGPLFVSGAGVLAQATSSSLVAQVIVLRAIELLGMVFIAIYLPRLATRLGADPSIARWLGVLSPLALFSFVASGHNDGLMVGLLVAGVTIELEGRHSILGPILCALALTVKVPAVAALVFLAVAEMRSVSRRDRVKAALRLVLVPALTVVAVTEASGLGWGWLGPSALRVPATLRVLSTPADAVGQLAFHAMRLVGIPVRASAVVSVVELVFAAVAALGGLWLVSRVKKKNLVRSLAVAFVLVVLAGPILWPWYLMWGVTLFAATSAQRSWILAATAGLAMLVIGPSGSSLLDGSAYLVVGSAWVLAITWLVRQRRWMTVVAGAIA